MKLGVTLLQEKNIKLNFVELYNNSKFINMLNLIIKNNRFNPIYTFIERSPSMQDVSPLFIIHSGNTGSDVYRPLFTNINESKYPIYVIEPHNLLRTEGERINGIDNIAKYYIKLIKNFKPENNLKSIRLMGWSYGGVVASEMAYQLTSEGIIRVEELLVLDSPFF